MKRANTGIKTTANYGRFPIFKDLGKILKFIKSSRVEAILEIVSKNNKLSRHEIMALLPNEESEKLLSLKDKHPTIPLGFSLNKMVKLGLLDVEGKKQQQYYSINQKVFDALIGAANFFNSNK